MNSTAEVEQLFNRFTKISEDLCHLMQTTDDGDKKKQMRKDFNEVQKLILSIHKYKIHLQLTNIY
jgi:hypothetical protein